MRYLFVGPVIAALAAPASARAQDASGAPPREALEQLEGITVIGRRQAALAAETRNVVPVEDLRARDAATVADAVRLAPSAHVQTNSRGETLVFLRNAGERQIALFYDGALLNIPWDNRIDLALLPAGLTGAIETASGPVSSQYGANVSGGVVNLLPMSPSSAGDMTVRAEAGESGAARIEGEASARRGVWSGLISGGRTRHDGQPLSGDADLPFSQADPDTRANTDAALQNVAARLGVAAPFGDIGLTLVYAAADKGVAPESDRDPEAENVRFWRYPDTELFMSVLSADAYVGERGYLKGAAWAQIFDQTIDSFASDAYAVLEDRQQDENLTAGFRVIYAHEFGAQSVKLSLNALDSRHRQREFDGASVVTEPEQSFRGQTFSAGAEWDADLGAGINVVIGANADVMRPRDTGDKPALDDFLDYGVNAGVVKRLGAQWSVRAAAGRKSRFPTLRELFGTAINRFLENPDLEAESTVLAELGAVYEGDRARVSLTPFARLTSDAIDQRTVIVMGNSLRQRINLDGVRTFGVEANADVQLSERLRVFGFATAAHVRKKGDFLGNEDRVAEKPALIARATAVYDHPAGWAAQVELDHTGRAFSPDAGGALTPLEISTQINLRASYDLARLTPNIRSAQVYLRLDNVTDAFVEPQLGLPAAGRWLRGGVRLAF